jgi:hypothetical protein
MLAGLWINVPLSKSRLIVPFIARPLTIHYTLHSFNNQGIPIKACFLHKKASRADRASLEEPSVTGQRLAVTSAPQQPAEELGSNQNRKKHSDCFLTVLKGILDAIQRLTCIGLGAWAFVRTNNYVEFAAIIAIGQVDTRSAKTIVERVLKAIINAYTKS